MRKNKQVHSGLNNRRILIIDDDPAVRSAYQAVLLGDQGPEAALHDEMTRLLAISPPTAGDALPRFELHFAAQGEEGFALVDKSVDEGNPFALAFLDIRMPPGWDGMETARRIRQRDPNIELVIVTAYSDRSRAEIVKTVGSPDKLLFLRKPFDPEELRQIALSQTEKWNLSRRHDAQRRQLEAVLAAAPTAIVTIDRRDHTVQSWNQAAEQVTGYPAAEIIGTPCPIELDILGPATSEISIHDRSGRKKILTRNTSPILEQRGEARYVVISFWDITAVRAAETALKYSEARFRALVETTNDWVWEVDAEWSITYSSPIGRKLLGYDPPELAGKNFFDTLLPVQLASRFNKFFAKCVAEQSSFQGVERPTRRKDGSTVIIESSGVPILDSGGRVKGFRGIDRDVSQRKKDEEKRRQLEEQFRQSQRMESLGTLAGGIAHDFNNILTPIISGAQLCLLEVDPENHLYDILKSIHESGQRAADLIRQILTFSRKQLAKPQSLELNQLIKSFNKFLRRLIREDITLDLDLDDTLWNIFGDTRQMEQVLLNLTVNARDAIAGNGRITISTRNETAHGKQQVDIKGETIDGDYVVLSVHDDGIGMDQESRARIFEPFYTTKEVGAGTGLGLSTVYGIVEQHGGHIVLESEPRKGTTFHLYFKKSDPQAVVDQDAVTIPVRGGTETILLVEDDADVRSSIASALRHYGYQVIGAANGDEALKIINKSSLTIDLLLTDVVMPDINGRELGQKIRLKNPALPLLYMSGHPLDMITEKLNDIDQILFIPKPFSAAEIAEKVRQTLDYGANPKFSWGEMKF